MAKVIIEQFNPVTKCWNKLYEVEEEEFNENEPYKMDRYGGPYRVKYPQSEKKLDKPIYSVVDMEEDGEDKKEEPLTFSNFSNIDRDDIADEKIY